MPKLDRLARSVPDAHAIGDDLATCGIRLSLGEQVYDPTDPMGKMFFNILATFAEFDLLLRVRTRKGMALARALLPQELSGNVAYDVEGGIHPARFWHAECCTRHGVQPVS